MCATSQFGVQDSVKPESGEPRLRACPVPIRTPIAIERRLHWFGRGMLLSPQARRDRVSTSRTCRDDRMRLPRSSFQPYALTAIVRPTACVDGDHPSDRVLIAAGCLPMSYSCTPCIKKRAFLEMPSAAIESDQACPKTVGKHGECPVSLGNSARIVHCGRASERLSGMCQNADVS